MSFSLNNALYSHSSLLQRLLYYSVSAPLVQFVVDGDVGLSQGGSDSPVHQVVLASGEDGRPQSREDAPQAVVAHQADAAPVKIFESNSCVREPSHLVVYILGVRLEVLKCL